MAHTLSELGFSEHSIIGRKVIGVDKGSTGIVEGIRRSGDDLYLTIASGRRLFITPLSRVVRVEPTYDERADAYYRAVQAALQDRGLSVADARNQLHRESQIEEGMKRGLHPDAMADLLVEYRGQTWPHRWPKRP